MCGLLLLLLLQFEVKRITKWKGPHGDVGIQKNKNMRKGSGGDTAAASRPSADVRCANCARILK